MSTDTRMQCIKSSCSAASRRYNCVAGTCDGRKMRRWRPSCMPSKDHIDGDHPPHSQSFHQSLCTCDPCKALTKRTLMASPHAVDIRELEILLRSRAALSMATSSWQSRHAHFLRHPPARRPRDLSQPQRSRHRYPRRCGGAHRKPASTRPLRLIAPPDSIVNA